MPNFDPFARAWEEYDANGLGTIDGPGLNSREAPLIVISAADLLNDSQMDQVLSSAAEEGHELTPQHLRWMVMPDAFPITPNHLNVVGARAISYHDASDVERHTMEQLTNATRRHVDELLAPANGTSVFIFGEDVPTMHTHVVPRTSKEAGLNWTQPRTKLAVAARHLVRAEVDFSLVTRGEEQIVRRMSRALLRFTQDA